MFFVTEEGITMSMVVGGTSNLDSAKKLAESRAKSKLSWNQIGSIYQAVLNCGTYSITYKIEQEA